jgi:chromosome segregation ATPase
MANELHAARKNVKALLPNARAVIALDEALDELSDVERLIADAKAKKEQHTSETQSAWAACDEAKRQLSLVNSQVEEAQNKAKSIIDAAVAEGDQITAAAKAIRAQAADEARAIVESAQQDSKRLEGDTRASLNEIERAIEQARNTLANINAEIVTATGALEVVKADRDALIRRLKG